MKRLLTAIFFCVGITAMAMLEMPKVDLQIADATPFGSTALNFAVLRFGEAGESAGVTRCDGANALRGLEAGKFQFALIDREMLPPSCPWKVLPAFCDVLVAYVNLNNRVKAVSHEKLVVVWSGIRPVWSTLGGGAHDIHRYGIAEGRPGGEAVADILKLRTPGMGITWLNGTSEALLYASHDTAALVLGRYQDEYPAESVRPLAIDGVLPDAQNIFSGKYPLMRRFVWVFPASAGEVVQKFLPYLADDIFYRSLLDEDLLPDRGNQEKKE